VASRVELLVDQRQARDAALDVSVIVIVKIARHDFLAASWQGMRDRYQEQERCWPPKAPTANRRRCSPVRRRAATALYYR
jgi:hypothetical protein